MLFLKKLFSRKPELSFAEKKEAFAVELLKIEEKYLLFFKNRLRELSGGLPDQLQNHYYLRKEFEYIRFDYRPGSDLPGDIRKECDAAYQKVWGNN
jgi:hypothetical protein